MEVLFQMVFAMMKPITLIATLMEGIAVVNVSTQPVAHNVFVILKVHQLLIHHVSAIQFLVRNKK